jgi:hypothetical protein
MALIPPFALVNYEEYTITITQSDADPHFWHAKRIRAGDGPRHINRLSNAEQDRDTCWLGIVGMRLARLWNLPQGTWLNFQKFKHVR